MPITKEKPAHHHAHGAAKRLREKNELFKASHAHTGDISPEMRRHTAENGQTPYAVVITCSDSRVPVEHIFHAGIGELFVIRTAGNVIGDHELGSIEYGTEHLHAKLVVVLGHTHCGAVAAAMGGHARGSVAKITEKIAACLPEGCTPREAEVANVENSIARIMESEIIQEMVEHHEVMVRGAIYDIESGHVHFLDDLGDELEPIE